MSSNTKYTILCEQIQCDPKVEIQKILSVPGSVNISKINKIADIFGKIRDQARFAVMGSTYEQAHSSYEEKREYYLYCGTTIQEELIEYIEIYLSEHDEQIGEVMRKLMKSIDERDIISKSKPIKVPVEHNTHIVIHKVT